MYTLYIVFVVICSSCYCVYVFCNTFKSSSAGSDTFGNKFIFTLTLFPNAINIPSRNQYYPYSCGGYHWEWGGRPHSMRWSRNCHYRGYESKDGDSSQVRGLGLWNGKPLPRGCKVSLKKTLSTGSRWRNMLLPVKGALSVNKRGINPVGSWCIPFDYEGEGRRGRET